jgi:hypothetical protein
MGIPSAASPARRSRAWRRWRRSAGGSEGCARGTRVGWTCRCRSATAWDRPRSARGPDRSWSATRPRSASTSWLARRSTPGRAGAKSSLTWTTSRPTGTCWRDWRARVGSKSCGCGAIPRRVRPPPPQRGVSASGARRRAQRPGRRLLAIALADARLAEHGVTLAAPRRARSRGAHVALAHPEARALSRGLIERGVIVDFRGPDVIRLGLSPLTTRLVDVWDGVEVLRVLSSS